MPDRENSAKDLRAGWIWYARCGPSAPLQWTRTGPVFGSIERVRTAAVPSACSPDEQELMEAIKQHEEPDIETRWPHMQTFA